MMNSAHRFMPWPAIKSNGGIECDLMLASNEPQSREDAPRQLRLTSDHLLARFSTIGYGMQEYLRLSIFCNSFFQWKYSELPSLRLLL